MMPLADYYQGLGFSSKQWHIGSEHPKLEEYAIELLQKMHHPRVLEVGYQAGAFSVPVISAGRALPGFSYLGIDSLAYENSVNGQVIEGYLKREGISHGYRFAVGDAGHFLETLPQKPPFDMILIDHYKPLYAREFHTVLKRGLLSDSGVVLMHDILNKARQAWSDCQRIARAYGYTWTINSDIPEGLAIIRKDPTSQTKPWARTGVKALLGVQAVKRGAQSLVQRILRPRPVSS